MAAHNSWQAAIEKAILEQGHVGPYIRRLARKQGAKIPSDPSEVRTLIDHALYYVDPGRALGVQFLGEKGGISYRELVNEPELSGEDCLARFDGAGLRIAIADVTSPDLLDRPFRVARAIARYIQQIDFGHHMRRLANPRLAALLDGRPVNPAPHPIA
jgi:ribosomal protein S12 methylthiotransferase accessory factor